MSLYYYCRHSSRHRLALRLGNGVSAVSSVPLAIYCALRIRDGVDLPEELREAKSNLER